MYLVLVFRIQLSIYVCTFDIYFLLCSLVIISTTAISLLSQPSHEINGPMRQVQTQFLGKFESHFGRIRMRADNAL